MTTIHLTKASAPEVCEIALLAFPGYKGNKFKIQVRDGEVGLASYWQEGSRDSYVFVNLAEKKTVALPSNHPYFEAGRMDRIERIPDGMAIVCHSVYAGKDMGLTVMVPSVMMNNLALPAPMELTDDEKIVLSYTSGRKSSYAGISNYRFVSARRDKGITLARWETAKSSLIDKGLLTKAGAITAEGRNANGDTFV